MAKFKRRSAKDLVTDIKEDDVESGSRGNPSTAKPAAAAAKGATSSKQEQAVAEKAIPAAADTSATEPASQAEPVAEAVPLASAPQDLQQPGSAAALEPVKKGTAKLKPISVRIGLDLSSLIDKAARDRNLTTTSFYLLAALALQKLNGGDIELAKEELREFKETNHQKTPGKNFRIPEDFLLTVVDDLATSFESNRSMALNAAALWLAQKGEAEAKQVLRESIKMASDQGYLIMKMARH